ncbi:hypothetical protein [uncultured Mobiluncus sp.]|uniref:hypothetical protein n=1 Tax=uncultured Mobiluncus sp. TaxID=293425 RepID=UPI002620CB58|nr:hypothetical protein [uncultured Mobiluncus sp.]
MNITNLTLGEIAAIEKYSGKKLADFQDESNADVRTMCAFGYVIAKRLGLQVEMSDIEQLSIDEITQLIYQDLPTWTDRGEKTEKIAQYLAKHPADIEQAGE